MTRPEGSTGFARRALSTLIAKEASLWRRSQAWWSQPALFLALTGGALALPLVLLRDLFASEPGGVAAGAVSVLTGLFATAPAIAAVLWFQNALVGERQNGTAAWILSKPVPRWSLPAAKLIVHGGLTLASSLVLPGLVSWGVLALTLSSPPSPGRYVVALAVLALHTLFYASLALALGAISDARGLIVAVPLALLMGGDLLMSAVPAAAHVTPLLLGRGAGALMQGGPFPVPDGLVATAVLSTALIAAALWRFGRRDL